MTVRIRGTSDKVEVVKIRREAVTTPQTQQRVAVTKVKREILNTGPQEKVVVRAGNGKVGPTGPAGVGLQEIFVQPTAPTVVPPRDHIWIQTGVGVGGFGWIIWFDNGA